MEISLKNDESMDEGIRRIFTTLVDETKSLLIPPHRDIHESIHKARKSFQFIRALLRLIKSPLGPEGYEKENAVLREMEMFLSEVRNTHLLPVIMRYVTMEAHSVDPSDMKNGLNELEERAKKALEKARSGEQNLESIAAGLKNCKKRMEQWPEIPDSLEAVLPGLKEVYGEGRQEYFEARDHTAKENYGEWLQKVRYLLHHYEVLAGYWPEGLGINAKSLQQLSDYLGEKNDLALFGTLLEDQSFRDKLTNAEALESFIDQKRSFLDRSALNLGDFIYSRPEEEFIAYFKKSANLTK